MKYQDIGTHVRLGYPYKIIHCNDGDYDGVLIPALPEAITQVAVDDDINSKLVQIYDCIVTALSFYVEDRREIPMVIYNMDDNHDELSNADKHETNSHILLHLEVSLAIWIFNYMIQNNITEVELSQACDAAGMNWTLDYNFLELPEFSTLQNIASYLVNKGEHMSPTLDAAQLQSLNIGYSVNIHHNESCGVNIVASNKFHNALASVPADAPWFTSAQERLIDEIIDDDISLAELVNLGKDKIDNSAQKEGKEYQIGFVRHS